MGTVAPSALEKPRPTGRWIAVIRLVLFSSAIAWLGMVESRRVDSRVPAMDDHLLGVMQKFLPPGRKGPLVLESRPDQDTRVFAPAPDDSPLPVPLCRYEKADQSILVEWPPGPVDLAMAIETLGAAKSLVLAWAPEWDAPAEGTLALRALANARAQAANLPVLHAYWPGFTAAVDEAALSLLQLPPALERTNVRGDVEKIPEVNEPGPWPPEGTGLLPADAGFGRLFLLSPLDAPPGRVALPMLVRSGDRILPSLALLAFARVNGIDFSNMDVHLGRAILAGKTAIPVDERGCLLLPVTFADRVPVFSPLAEDAHSIVQGKPVVIAYEGLPAQNDAKGDVGLWIAAALGAMEADDFALPIRVLRRAADEVGIGVTSLLILGCVFSLWLPRRQRWWVVIAMFTALTIAARHAANAHGQFIGLTIPFLTWVAASLMALWYAPPALPKPSPLPLAPEPADAPPHAPPGDKTPAAAPANKDPETGERHRKG